MSVRIRYREKNSSSRGMSLVGTLTVIFIVLKLVKVIDWSWWWVLSPLWIGIPLTLLVILAVFIIIYIMER